MFNQVKSFSNLFSGGFEQIIKRSATCIVYVRGNSTVAVPQLEEELKTAKSFEELPGPKPLPVIGNAWRFLPYIGTFPLDFVELQRQLHSQYGQIVKITDVPGRSDIVLLTEPEDMEKVYRNEGPWPIRDSIKSLEYYRKVTRKDIFGDVGGAVVNQGEEWQQFRSKVNQPMMQPRTTKMYVAPIDAVASDFLKRIKYLRDKNMEMPSNFVTEFYKWALESIVYIALDTRIGCLNEEVDPDSEPMKMINSVQVIFDGMFKLDLRISPWRIISTPTWRNFVKASDFFTNASMKYINQAMERLKNMPPDSDRELTVLEKILAIDPNPKTAIVMASDMMIAGVDTTSYASVVLLYFLAKNPDKQEKLFNEIVKHLPEKDQPITSNILNDLKYLKACMKEAMRIKPIAAGNVRKLVKDLVLSGYRVPKGTDVAINNMMICSLEKHFKDAKKYIPERWLRGENGEEADVKKTHPFVFMPFGFGPRMCLGRRFAELEIETLVTRIVRNFRVEYNYGEMQFQSRLLYIPISPLKFRFIDRN